MEFRDRREAGRALAKALAAWRGRSDVVVLALPRGGVPVAWEVAQALDAPLDVLVVRKLGFPGQEEFAMGAIASGGVRVMSDLPGVLAGVGAGAGGRGRARAGRAGAARARSTAASARRSRWPDAW